MTRYRFELANRNDDAALRHLMASTPMPGKISLAFTREPSYFDSNHVLGRGCQTIIGRDTQHDEIVIVGTRSMRDMFVAGTPQRVGYLSGLRCIESARNRGLLARGFQFLHQLHLQDPDPPPFYLTTIADGNTRALEALTSGRAGLPNYHPLGQLKTYAIPIRPIKSKSITTEINCEARNDIDELVAFLNREGSKRNFFPVYSREDFDPSSGTFRDLKPSQTIVARQAGEIVGAAGTWDQSSFRQTVVCDYPPLLRATRPMLNQWNRWVGGVTLPRINQAIRNNYVSFPVVTADDSAVFRSLLKKLMQVSPKSAQMLLTGLCDKDPLQDDASRLTRIRYTTHLYAVSWTPIPTSKIPDSPYYLELGCL